MAKSTRKSSDAKTPKTMPRGGKPEQTHESAAEQVREAAESAKAHSAEASIRDRMVDIGRGNKQAGRQKS